MRKHSKKSEGRRIRKAAEKRAKTRKEARQCIFSIEIETCTCLQCKKERGQK